MLLSDYKAEAERTVHPSLSLIEFSFKTSNKIEYVSIIPSEIYSLIIDTINRSDKLKVSVAAKDVTVYLSIILKVTK